MSHIEIRIPLTDLGLVDKKKHAETRAALEEVMREKEALRAKLAQSETERENWKRWTHERENQIAGLQEELRYAREDRDAKFQWWRQTDEKYRDIQKRATEVYEGVSMALYGRVDHSISWEQIISATKIQREALHQHQNRHAATRNPLQQVEDMQKKINQVEWDGNHIGRFE